MVEYLDKVIRPLVLVLPKVSEYVKTFKVTDKNNKLMSFHIDDDEKELEKYKTFWTKIEDLRNIILNTLPVYDDRCIKLKIIINENKVYTNFRELNIPDNDIE